MLRTQDVALPSGVETATVPTDVAEPGGAWLVSCGEAPPPVTLCLGVIGVGELDGGCGRQNIAA
jgi:hypothetical protein